MNIDISEVLGIAVRKALIFKGVNSFTKKEIEEFIKKLFDDEEFLNAYQNIIKVAK